MKMALAPDESGILGGQKWHLHTQKLHFCGFQGEQRGRKGAVYYALFSRMGVQAEGAWTIFALQVTGLAQSFLQQIW